MSSMRAGLAGLLWTLLVLPRAEAHLSGPHEPLLLALQRAESVLVVRAERETRRTAEGAETPVTRLASLDGRAAPQRFVLTQVGAHVHRLRRGGTYLVPVKRSVSGRVLVDFSSEAPVSVAPDDVRSDDLRAAVRSVRSSRRGSRGASAGLDVARALSNGHVVLARLAIERVSLVVTGVDSVSASQRSSWVGALATRASDPVLDPVARSEALQLSAGLDPGATADAVGDASLTWAPDTLAHQAAALLERAETAPAHQRLKRCADGQVPGVTTEMRARCKRAAERGL